MFYSVELIDSSEVLIGIYKIKISQLNICYKKSISVTSDLLYVLYLLVLPQ